MKVKPFESDTHPGKWGICDDSGLAVVYECEFDSEQEALAIIRAHDQGAETFEQAIAMITARD